MAKFGREPDCGSLLVFNLKVIDNSNNGFYNNPQSLIWVMFNSKVTINN